MNDCCFGIFVWFWVMACMSLNMFLWTFGCLPLSCLVLPRLTRRLKKSIRLREEALAKEQVKTKSGQSSAEKLRKILKEEKR